MKGPRRYFIVNLRIDELELLQTVLALPDSFTEVNTERRTRLYQKIKAIRERLEVRQAYEIRKGNR